MKRYIVLKAEKGSCTIKIREKRQQMFVEKICLTEQEANFCLRQKAISKKYDYWWIEAEG
jgi:hypothetical protein